MATEITDENVSQPWSKTKTGIVIASIILGLALIIIPLLLWKKPWKKDTSPSGFPPQPSPSPEGDDDEGGGGGPSPSPSASPQSSSGPSSTPSPPAPAPTAQSEYCDQRTDVTLAGGSGCKHYNDSRSKCLKYYQNPNGNDADTPYGEGRLCKWNSGSDYPCKNNGESCKVAASPIIADFMEKGQYCYGMQNTDQYAVNKGTKSCSKFDKNEQTGAKQKCQTRFQYPVGSGGTANKSALGMTNTCSWSGDSSGKCSAKGKRCLRAVAPNGQTSPNGGDGENDDS